MVGKSISDDFQFSMIGLLVYIILSEGREFKAGYINDICIHDMGCYATLFAEPQSQHAVTQRWTAR